MFLDHGDFLYPFSPTGFAYPPSTADIRQWLDGVASGGASLTDKKPTVTPTPIPAVVTSLTIDGTGDLVNLPSALLDDATLWTVQFEIPAYTATNALEAIAGGAINKFIGVYSSAARPLFRDSSSVYHYWNGTGDTIAYDTSLGGNFVFTSDGTKVYLYVDGVSKGYVTPATTQMYFSKYGAGYADITFSYTGKIWSMAAWSSYSSDGTYDYSTALFAHPLEDGLGDTAEDVSGNGNEGTLVPVGTLASMWTTDDDKPCRNLLDGFHENLNVLEFNAASSVIEPGSYEFGDDDFTLHARFKVPFSQGGPGYANLIGSGILDSAAAYAMGIAAHSTTTNQIRVFCSTAAGGGYENIYLSSALANGWHTADLKRVGDTVTGYIDDVSIGSGANSLTYPAKTFKVGNYVSSWFGGYLRDVHAYSQKDTTDAANGVGFKFPLSFGSGTTAVDSLYNNDATITDGAWTTDSEVEAKSPAKASEDDVSPLTNIVALGDSNTRSLSGGKFPDMVDEAHYCVSVVNEGIGGDTAAGLLARITNSVTNRYQSDKTNILTIWTGVNDYARTVADVITDIQSIATTATAQGYSVVLMKYYIWPDHGTDYKAYLTSLNDALEVMATAQGFTLLDFVDVLNDGTGYLKTEYQETPGSNGHLNTAGHAVIYPYIQTAIDSILGSYGTGSVSASGELLTNPGGYANNGACSTIQHPDATELLDNIIVIADGVEQLVPLIGETDSRPEYQIGALADPYDWRCHHTSGYWSLYNGDDEFRITSDSPYPPKTGWIRIGGSFVTNLSIEFKSEHIEDDGTLVDLSFADELAHVSGNNGYWIQWKKGGSGSTCLKKESIQYNQFREYPLSEYQQLLAWCHLYTDECGAGVMTPFLLTDDTPYLLSSGAVFLVNPV